MTAYREGQHITPKYFKKLQDKTEPVKRIMGGVNVSVWVLVSVCFLSFFFTWQDSEESGQENSEKRENVCIERQFDEHLNSEFFVLLA